MKLNYHPETDSLYIDLSEATSVETREVSEGVSLDYDAACNLVGIDIDNASRKIQMEHFIVSNLPAAVDQSGVVQDKVVFMSNFIEYLKKTVGSKQ